ncbi:Protein DMSR-6, partial [Aphelenchoides avenae]
LVRRGLRDRNHGPLHGVFLTIWLAGNAQRPTGRLLFSVDGFPGILHRRQYRASLDHALPRRDGGVHSLLVGANDQQQMAAPQRFQ